MNVTRVSAGLAALTALLLFPWLSYNDPDTFWHIENGRYMIAHGTILHHAIHTFYGDSLPYVPHEFGFQIPEALLYGAFGWPGIYLLTAVSFLLLIVGLYRLMQISRQEIGLSGMPVLCYVLLALVGAWVYYGYFKSRPQMISAFLIVWYVVWMRRYAMSGRWRCAAAMTLLSLAIANVHAGVWLVIAVFSGMQIAASVLERKFRGRDAVVYAAAAIAGFLNPGGYRSLFYILTVTKNHFNLLIDEWRRLDFGNWENIPIVLALVFFAYVLPFSLRKKAFRIFLAIGIAYLGTTNFKQNLFLWLFLPYFAASAMDRAPLLRRMPDIPGPRIAFAALAGMAVGFVLNVALVFAFPPQTNARQYPVDEMNYVMAGVQTGVRPKVLARYGSSGYVMFRGADILCDGRQDPFITDATKGLWGWTAFERSMYGFSDRLPAIVREDRPDYVIAQRTVSDKLMQDWTNAFGEPVYRGRYGAVFRISQEK
ncbi:hypothetical protein [Cohnella sp. REN36]|uniref:hypothetical protein n=1 Tax=Cohnella sp. REN36 TaxID=2887347 RepID=UPI001D15C89B|nr:hypothetical protein [Cohnella sp. REN36]MCC3371497.1 hypothetical protein [Cohnella sp. REN36]